jgi:putative exosortase-associated protein (TIGR04073 family)
MLRRIVSLGLLLFLPAAARAECSHATLEKLGRGVAGVTAGVLELPNQMVAETGENGLASGLTVGFAKGLGGVVTRELVGLSQILSAPFAGPAGLDTAMAHAYPWGAIQDALREEDTDLLARLEKELGSIRGVQVERSDGALRVRFPEDLLFAFDSAALSPSAAPRLTGLAETLARHPDTAVQVQGFTDASGHPAYNLYLSEERASVVREFLVAHGVDASRIDAAGYGSAAPIASNDTLEGRRSNRRVELLWLSGVAAGR